VTDRTVAVDLVLSSGFLAFARHVGFLAAVEAAPVRAEAVCGTSSGALVAALWAAGLRADDIADLIAGLRPWALVRPRARPWSGAFDLRALISLLRARLPPAFSDLPIPFAAGVVGRHGHRFVTTGDLPAAVAASCATPHLFAPVWVDGEPCHDGGAADRVGLEAWRAWRPGRRAIVHAVARTAGVDVAADRSGTHWVDTPRSGASFWSLGDVRAQAAVARTLAAPVVAALAADLDFDAAGRRGSTSRAGPAAFAGGGAPAES